MGMRGKTVLVLAIAVAFVIGTMVAGAEDVFAKEKLTKLQKECKKEPKKENKIKPHCEILNILEELELIGEQRPGQVPIGTVLSYAGSTAPTNFMIADGSEISRTTFSALFNIIGTTYGAGDGSATFNLPDLSNTFVRGITTGTPGSTGGADSHTHSVDPPNTFSSTAPGHVHTIDPAGISSSNNGNHAHGVNSGPQSTSFDSHNHFVPSTTGGFLFDCESLPCSVASPGTHTHSITGGSHQHSIQILTSTDFELSHNHFTDIPQFASATSGFHNHQADIVPFSSASADSKPPFIELVMIIRVQ